MSFITRRRGYLLKHPGPFNDSMLLHQVPLDEYLALQYPALLLEQYPDQAQNERARERSAIEAVMLPGDTLWLWRDVDSSNVADGAPFERGGLALRRGDKVVRVWLAWQGY